ncbi:hypothetical protein D3C80_729340 [compost metagenome]
MRRAERVCVGQPLHEVGDIFKALVGGKCRQVDQIQDRAFRRCPAGNRGAELWHHLFRRDLGDDDLVVVLGVVLLGKRLQDSAGRCANPEIDFLGGSKRGCRSKRNCCERKASFMHHGSLFLLFVALFRWT